MKKWLWVLYPVIVLIIIGVSGNMLFLNQERWVMMLEDQQKAEEQEIRIAELKKKLGVLSLVDFQVEADNLKRLIEAQPPKKSVWTLISEMKSAADEGGVAIGEFKGGIGGVREATGSGEVDTSVVVSEDVALSLTVGAEVGGLSNLKSFLESLDKLLPLARINQIDYTTGTVVMEIESAWKPWEVVAGVGGELPDYKAEVERVKARLADYYSLPAVEIIEASGSAGSVSPF